MPLKRQVASRRRRVWIDRNGSVIYVTTNTNRPKREAPSAALVIIDMQNSYFESEPL